MRVRLWGSRANRSTVSLSGRDGVGRGLAEQRSELLPKMVVEAGGQEREDHQGVAQRLQTLRFASRNADAR